eukprot:445845-Alexandrium_andersonii.AAC.1
MPFACQHDQCPLSLAFRLRPAPCAIPAAPQFGRADAHSGHSERARTCGSTVPACVHLGVCSCTLAGAARGEAPSALAQAPPA